MFYESQHSVHSDLFKLNTGLDFCFPAHLHSSFELIVLRDGELEVIIGQQLHQMHAGDAVLIFPNQLHSIVTPEHSSILICIFSPKLVQAFANLHIAQVPEQNRFQPEDFYIMKLAQLRSDTAAADMTRVKGVLYSLCAEFDAGATYRSLQEESQTLLAKIFPFVEQHFQDDCSLGALAKYTGYHYVYLSRYFRQCTGLTYLEYVNHFRIDQACYILENSRQPIAQVAYDCGFDSLRSFNRNFRKVKSITPKEYRDRFLSRT